MKKLSGGKPQQEQSQPDDFVLYLDENLCNCQKVIGVLESHTVRYERHLSHFPPGTADEDWLPIIGQHGWCLLTTDKRFRYNELERMALRRYGVKGFEFSTNQGGAAAMAASLEIALPQLKSMAKHQRGPFVASITRSGVVRLKWTGAIRRKPKL